MNAYGAGKILYCLLYTSKLQIIIKLIVSWLKIFFLTKKNDIVIYQHPMCGMPISIKLLKSLSRKVKIITIIHDLNYLRTHNERYKYYDSEIVKISSTIICHNNKMAEYIKKVFPRTNTIELKVFDYLSQNVSKTNDITGTVCIAGNFSKNKSKYIYELGEVKNTRFKLFGINYDSDLQPDNVEYKGAFDADDLPEKLEGSFGLVWDGESIDTCKGDLGNYTRFNSPHKLSLYLASYIPVIVWTESAVSEFVRENNVGIIVSSLNEISFKLSELSDTDILEMKNNAIAIGDKIRLGYFTKSALEKSIKVLEINAE